MRIDYPEFKFPFSVYYQVFFFPFLKHFYCVFQNGNLYKLVMQYISDVGFLEKDANMNIKWFHTEWDIKWKFKYKAITVMEKK